MKYALIGCGRIAVNHIKAVVNNGLELKALCDIDPKQIERLVEKTKFTGNPERYTDYRKMFAEHPEIELAAIATESGCHAEIALFCIDHGINVIIEKPMALSMADADEIVKRASEKGVTVSVCHQNRFNSAVMELRQAIDAGRFGRISHGSINVRWNRGREYYEQAAWRGKWASDGGCLFNQCIHGIDLLRWLMGDEVDEVYGVTKRRIHDYIECEDIGMAVVRFRNGAVGTIEGTVNVYPKNLEETLFVFGEKGSVKLGGQATNSIELWNFADECDKDKENQGLNEAAPNVYGNGHTALYADVIDAVTKHRKPLVDAVAGRNAVEMILAIYLSSATGRPVKLPLKECASTDFTGEFDKLENK